MPSLSHEALLLLFRNRPELAPELLREALGVELPAYTEVRIEAADLTEVVPAEYRADLVVLLVDGKPVFAIVVEVQLARKERKRFTWPVYGTGLRARFECEAVVLVVAPSIEIARWAATPITLGPGSIFQPLVLGPDAVPVVVDRARALADPELAVLSVMAHGRGDVDLAVQIALAAVAGVAGISDPDRFVLYSDLIEAALSEAARKAFQMLPEGYEFQSETIRNSIEKGRVAEKAADVLEVLDARGLSITSEQRERILGCADSETLRRWLRAAVTVASVHKLFE
jgi:hypothetical protein